MPCHKRVFGNGELVEYICMRGPVEHQALRKRNKIKWCFNCRKRLPHMLTATIEKEPSYYEPNVWWKCSGCGKDYTSFPRF